MGGYLFGWWHAPHHRSTSLISERHRNLVVPDVPPQVERGVVRLVFRIDFDGNIT